MNAIRNLVHVDKANRSADAVFDEKLFWDGLVREVAEMWKKVDVSWKASYFRLSFIRRLREFSVV